MYPFSNDKDWKKESSDVTLINARRSSKGIIFFVGCNSTKYLLSRRKSVGTHIDEIQQNRVNVWTGGVLRAPLVTAKFHTLSCLNEKRKCYFSCV